MFVIFRPEWVAVPLLFERLNRLVGHVENDMTHDRGKGVLDVVNFPGDLMANVTICNMGKQDDVHISYYQETSRFATGMRFRRDKKKLIVVQGTCLAVYRIVLYWVNSWRLRLHKFAATIRTVGRRRFARTGCSFSPFYVSLWTTHA